MPHLSIGLPTSLYESPYESPGGSSNATARFPRASAAFNHLAAEDLCPSGCEVLAGLFWPRWPDKDTLTNLLVALLDLRKAMGHSIAIPSSFHVNLATVQFNVFSGKWKYPS